MFSKLFGNNRKEATSTLDSKLESARQKLIADLNQKGMAYFVTQMANNNLYSDLLIERQKTSISSEDTISMQAYRQSNKLHSHNDKNELLKLLSNENFQIHKRNIYCCLASICSNTNDKDLFNLLVDSVSNERDERTIVSILSRLEDVKKDSTFNIDIIKRLAVEGSSDISHAAIKALANSLDPEVEGILLDEFKIANKHMKGIICSSLETVGSLKAISTLELFYKKTKDRGLKQTIENTINKIHEKAAADSR